MSSWRRVEDKFIGGKIKVLRCSCFGCFIYWRFIRIVVKEVLGSVIELGVKIFKK